ncbi:MAG: histidine phosphatase family protein [Burkholderiales bacterium]|nr:MAG: histidine phosphatase family protein [Burkholderiales bacterium]
MATAGDDRFWALLREGGCILLMRHALTEPGIGDPPQFRLGDCSTQRNLSEAGREQSRRVARAFRSAGVRVGEVRSSAWCRCTETADLAFGRHRVWEPLNSFFGRDGGQAQTQAVLQALADFRGPDNLVLVTHQVNIRGLTGQSPAMGELFLARAAGAETLPVLARLSA